jgi:hypothetical protein
LIIFAPEEAEIFKDYLFILALVFKKKNILKLSLGRLL